MLDRVALGDGVAAVDRGRTGCGLRLADGAPVVALVLELRPLDAEPVKPRAGGGGGRLDVATAEVVRATLDPAGEKPDVGVEPVDAAGNRARKVAGLGRTGPDVGSCAGAGGRAVGLDAAAERGVGLGDRGAVTVLGVVADLDRLAALG